MVQNEKVQMIEPLTPTGLLDEKLTQATGLGPSMLFNPWAQYVDLQSLP